MARLFAHLSVDASEAVVVIRRDDLGSDIVEIGDARDFRDFAIHVRGTPAERDAWRCRVAAALLDGIEQPDDFTPEAADRILAAVMQQARTERAAADQWPSQGERMEAGA